MYGYDVEQHRAERGESNAYTQASVDDNDGEYDDALVAESSPKSKRRDTFARVLGDSTISGETTASSTPKRNKIEEGTSSTPATVTKGGLFSRWGRNETEDDDYPSDEYD